MSATMVSLKEELNTILNAERKESVGVDVPQAADIAHRGGVVRLDAAILYADLADSTGILDSVPPAVVAAIYQTFLKMSGRMIDHTQGKIAAFDGDRVMGVFVGPQKEANAVKCALHINWGMNSVLVPMLRNQFSTALPSSVVLGHGVGIDSSRLLAVRVGNKDAHDVAWVGRAANVAAKLSGLRIKGYPTVVTPPVHAAIGAPSAAPWTTSKWDAVKPSELHVCSGSAEL